MPKRLAHSIFCTLLACLLAVGCSAVPVVSDDVSPTSASPETSVSSAVPAAVTTASETTMLTTAAESTTVTEAATESTTAGPTATPKPTKKPTPTPTKAPASPYYLYAEMGSFTLVVYAKDSAGSYTKVVRIIRMAIGRGTMTRAGKYTISNKLRWKTFSSSVYAQYASQYKSGLYIHSPTYTTTDNTKMITSSYEQIGTKATSGCLRIPTADAFWIYSNCPAGTVLQIVSGSPRGFTAPALVPIRVAGQDPTDPDTNLNPTPTTAPPVETTVEVIETTPVTTEPEATTTEPEVTSVVPTTVETTAEASG